MHFDKHSLFKGTLNTDKSFFHLSNIVLIDTSASRTMLYQIGVSLFLTKLSNILSRMPLRCRL